MSVRSAVLMILLCCGPALSVSHLNAQQSSVGQQPTFRSGVELVTVDVGVVDRTGQPVRGLKAEDFVVTVAGQRRRVVTAEFVDAGAARSAFQPAVNTVPISTNEGGGAGRLVVFVVDSNSLETGDARQVAEGASQFLSGLTFADRSAVVSLPTGKTIAFTWNHNRVREALLRTSGTGGAATTWEYGSLSEARDIATRKGFALREIGSRECSADTLASSSGGGISSGSGQSSTGGSSSGSSGSGSSGGQSSGTVSGGGESAPSASSASNQCLREIQNNASMVWAMARANTLSSLASLRQVLAALRVVQGDKSIVLISGGWPLDEHEETSLLTTVSGEAAAAGATFFTLFVPRSPIAASRRMGGSTRLEDQHIYSSPLENLATMTDGRTFRADGGSAGIFERLTRELAGYYRIGVEKEPADAGAKDRRMKVQVTREGLTIRAREMFDVMTYEDRDWSARLAAALDSPAPATAVRLRVTSYVATDLEDPSILRLVFAGDASHLQPGEANLRLAVRDLEGRKVVAAEHQLGDSTGNVTFATNVRVPPGTYIVRLAVMDGAGRVGSVDHFVEARPVSLGSIAVTGPMLVQMPNSGQAEPRFTVDGVRQDERLALEVGLTGESATLEKLEVGFEIAATADGPPLVAQPATFSRERGTRSVLAQGVADVHSLPPGEYFARVKVKLGAEPIGEVRRAFLILNMQDVP